MHAGLKKSRALRQERQATSTGGVKPQLSLKSDEAGRTDEIVAEKLGIGGKDTYRKEKYIVDNADTLTPEDFAEALKIGYRQSPVFIIKCLTIHIILWYIY